MSLAAGTKLGPYEVEAAIGAGGMGEVYRARDTKLGRDVALKILPHAFARDAERLARFTREARLLASLNHPNIAQVYGLEDAGGGAIVMELVNGPTLADRIARGPIPVGEALAIAAQIAAALEAAHERGIIHRDLKPANVKVREDGTVKVLDFGLAKAMDPAAGVGPRGTETTNSPTLSVHATVPGTVLGTVAYMSPEQAAGRPVDKRSDVWALGVVVLEMLTGQAVFTGESGSHILAAVLTREPDWTKLPAATPPSLRKLLRRALEKDKARRLHDIGDMRLEIEEAQVELRSPSGAPVVPAAPLRPTHWLWAAGLLAAASSVLVGWLVLRALPSGSSAAKRLTFVAPPGARLSTTTTAYQHLAVSPRGDRVAFMGQAESGYGLYLQAIDDIEAHAVSGTEGAMNPFFSADGRWLGFAQRGNLKKVLLEGGAPVTITGLPGEGVLRGASWGTDGTIVFSPGSQTGLWRVPADGGTPRVVTTLEGDVISHRWPQILPGGKAVIFTIEAASLFASDSRIGILSLETGKWHVAVVGSGYARYSPTGHLVYARLGTLLAAPFDPVRLAMTGPAVPVLDDVQMNFNGHLYADYDISDTGSLVYVPGFNRPLASSLLWVDRQGHATPLSDRRQAYYRPRLSPDGRGLVVEVEGEPGSLDLLVLDLVQGSWLSLASAVKFNPISQEWSPDGRWVAFVSGNRTLMRTPADGSGRAERLAGPLPGLTWLNGWSPDGRAFIMSVQNSSTAWDIGILSVEGGEPRWLLAGPSIECCATLSPDGRFVAYISNESGRYTVLVRPFPGPGEKRAVSIGPGIEPRWSRDGREVFYRSLGDRPKLMAAAVETRGDLRAKAPRPLFDDVFAALSARVGYREASYDVAPDGRFLFVEQPKGAPAPTRLVLIPDWGSELKIKLGAARR